MTQAITKVENAKQLEMFSPSEITRPDINIGKMAGVLFSSPWAKDLYEIKDFTWSKEVRGEKVDGVVSIKPLTEQKRPTTTTYKVFLALVQIWEQSGKPADGKVHFSLRQLAHMLDMRWAGEKSATLLNEHLSILKGTVFDWKWMFLDQGVLETRNEGMSLIESKSSLERKDFLTKEVFTRQQRVRINADLVANMLLGHTKPINYLTYISIKDSCAKLYNLLDLYLSKKAIWERRSLGLIFDELELEGQRYKKRNLRLVKLKEFARELHNKELSTGKLQLAIKKTADGEDYKLIARKIPRVVKNRMPPKVANSKEDIPLIVEDIMAGLSELGSISGVSRGVLEALARWYSRNTLYRGLSVLKVDYKGKIKKSPIKAYVYVMHTIIHEQGKEWVNDCGKNCQYRLENKLVK